MLKRGRPIRGANRMFELTNIIIFMPASCSVSTNASGHSATGRLKQRTLDQTGTHTDMTLSSSPRPERLSIALYQPDIAGNAGTILRTAACLDFAVHIIEPAGFDLSDRALKRAGMDYLEMAALIRHVTWDAFEQWRRRQGLRLVLLTTKADTPYTAHRFTSDDILLFGSESAGVPETVHSVADERLAITMAEGARSLNLAVSVGIAAAEAIRQISVHS